MVKENKDPNTRIPMEPIIMMQFHMAVKDSLFAQYHPGKNAKKPLCYELPTTIISINLYKEYKVMRIYYVTISHDEIVIKPAGGEVLKQPVESVIERLIAARKIIDAAVKRERVGISSIRRIIDNVHRMREVKKG